MNDKQIRDKLIHAGVKNLKIYGYPAVNNENILTDKIYSAFFVSMLNDNLGQSSKLDAVINSLISDIQSEA